MGVLYLIRHGETLWNTEGRYQGQTDTPLSRSGEQQAQAVAKRLAHTSLDRIYSSDLERAYRTAMTIAKLHGLPITTHEGLREYKFGVWEGQKRGDIQAEFPTLFRRRQENSDITRIPGGELPSEVEQRAFSVISSIVQQWPESNIAVVSHGGVIRLLLAKMLHSDIKQAYRFQTGNTGVSRLVYTVNGTQVKWKATTINDTQHLGTQ